MIDMLEEMACNNTLLPAEHKLALSILRTIAKEATEVKKVDLDKLLVPPEVKSEPTLYHQIRAHTVSRTYIVPTKHTPNEHLSRCASRISLYQNGIA